MGSVRVKHTMMFDDYVSVFMTEDDNYPGEVLWEFRTYPKANDRVCQAIYAWEDYGRFHNKGQWISTHHVKGRLPLPLHDLDVLTLDDLRKMKLTEDMRLFIGKEEFRAVDWMHDSYHKCVDIEYQLVRPPFPDMQAVKGYKSPYKDWVVSKDKFPLITFDKAKELIDHSMNREEGYFAFSNCVITIVKKQERHKLMENNTFVRNKSNFKVNGKIHNRLTVDAINQIRLYLNDIHRQIALATKTGYGSMWSWYRCTQLVNNIEDGNRDLDAQWFMRGVVDYLDFSSYMLGALNQQTMFNYMEHYHVEYGQVYIYYMDYRIKHLDSMVFDYQVERVMMIPLCAMEPVYERILLDTSCYNYLQTCHFYAMAKGKKLIRKMNYEEISSAIRDKNTDYKTLEHIVERCYDNLKKSDRKELDKRIEKINERLEKKAKKKIKKEAKEAKRQEKIDKHDWIGSKRMSKEGKLIRLGQMFKTILPDIIGIAITAAIGAIALYFGKGKAPVPSFA